MNDYEAIVRLCTQYARAVDTRDWDRYEAVFAPDAVIDYTSSGGIRGTVGEVRVWIEAAMGPFTMSQHLVVNHDVVVDGDTATCHSDFYNPMGRPDGRGGTALLFVGGSYQDRLRRQGGRWVIAERVETMAWFTGDWPDDVALEA